MLTGLACSGGPADPGSDGGHTTSDSQQILLGSMGGDIRAGRYMVMPRASTSNDGGSGNLPYNCFLISLLQLMGVPASEYQQTTPGNQGFGSYTRFSRSNWDHVRHRFYQPITELIA